MNFAHIDNHDQVFEADSRREHERYACNDTDIRFFQIGPGLSKVDPVIEHALLKDISLKGLAIESQQLFKPGDILSLEIDHDESQPKELLTAVIMWCKTSNDNDIHQAGLRVVKTNRIEPSESTESGYHRSNQNQLVCPSCDETSFFLRKISSSADHSDIYYCGHCGNRHEITDVMAFNRKL